jgi:Zn-finger nucleic acid-binding protein
VAAFKPLDKSMLRCPQCDVPMNEVTVRANPGSLIQLDQCRQCGGIWCDKWELFPIDADEAKRLDSLNEKLLAALTPQASKPLYCPRCTGRLARLKEPLLPEEIVLQRCSRCEGIWLNRGQMASYKNYQKSTRLKKMGIDSAIRKLPEACQNPQSWVVTGTDGMFAYPRGIAANDEPVAASVGSAFKFILQTLVRMALGI